jgi:hypothetical protein
MALAAHLGAREGQQLVDDLERVLCGEPVGQSDEGDLVGEPQAATLCRWTDIFANLSLHLERATFR